MDDGWIAFSWLSRGFRRIPVTVPKSAGLSFVGTSNWRTSVLSSMYFTCAFEPPGTKMQIETGLQQTFRSFREWKNEHQKSK